MKSYMLLAIVLVGCTANVEGFDNAPAISMLSVPNSSPHQAPNDRLQCVRPGIYTIQFLPTEQAESNGSCNGITPPTITSLDITDQVPFLGCTMELDNETCTFNAIDPSCQPSFDNTSYGWSGKLVFEDVHMYVPVYVNGKQVYEAFNGFYGIGTITVQGLCSFGVFLKEASDT